MTGAKKSSKQEASWKPPPDTGTRDAERAGRWQGQGGQGQEKESPRAASRGTTTEKKPKAAEDGNKRVSVKLAGEDKASPKPSSRGPSPKAGKKKDPEFVPEAEPMPRNCRQFGGTLGDHDEEGNGDEQDNGDEEQFRANWFAGNSGCAPTKGQLRYYTTDPILRPGMSHPPQNPKVSNDLIAYLQAYKVPSEVEVRPQRIPSKERNRYDDDDEDDTSCASSSRNRSRRRSSTAESDSGGLLPGMKGKGLGDTNRSLMSSMSMGNKSGKAPGSTGKNEMAAWIHEMQNKGAKGPLAPTERELHRWTDILVQNSRRHGIGLRKADTYDLAELSMYHNRMSRTAFSKSMPVLKADSSGGKQMRDLSSTMSSMTSDKDEATAFKQKPKLGLSSQSFGGFSENSERLGAALPPTRRLSDRDMMEAAPPPRRIRPLSGKSHGTVSTGSFADSSGGERAWSSQKLARMAQEVQKTSNNAVRLQQLARTANVSVITMNKMRETF